MSSTKAFDPARRRIAARLVMGVLVVPALLRSRRAQAADLPLLDPSSAAARKLKYVSDATQSEAAAKGNSCSNCGLYQGAYGSKQGPCQLFAGEDVLAGGWCSSWEPQM